MNLLRRRFLGSSLVVLGSSFLDALTTPLWKWRGAMRLEATPMPDPPVSDSPAVSPVRFVDAAREAGLTIPNVWGGVDQKKYIIEAKGSGIAFFDYDHDGWLDIYLTNGTRFDTNWPAGKRASASATTTMTAGTISSAAFGDTTSCFTIMATARSPMSLATPASTTNKSDGEPDVPGSTTTATATLIFSSAITSSSIRKRLLPDRKSTRL